MRPGRVPDQKSVRVEGIVVWVLSYCLQPRASTLIVARRPTEPEIARLHRKRSECGRRLAIVACLLVCCNSPLATAGGGEGGWLWEAIVVQKVDCCGVVFAGGGGGGGSAGRDDLGCGRGLVWDDITTTTTMVWYGMGWVRLGRPERAKQGVAGRVRDGVMEWAIGDGFVELRWSRRSSRAAQIEHSIA